MQARSEGGRTSLFRKTIRAYNVLLGHAVTYRSIYERNSVASCVNQFDDFLITLVKKCGGVRKMNKECVTNTCVEKTRAFPRNKLFDGECKSQKRIVNDAKKLFYALPTDCHLREEYFFQKRVFKKLLKERNSQHNFNFRWN